MPVSFMNEYLLVSPKSTILYNNALNIIVDNTAKGADMEVDEKRSHKARERMRKLLMTSSSKLLSSSIMNRPGQFWPVDVKTRTQAETFS